MLVHRYTALVCGTFITEDYSLTTNREGQKGIECENGVLGILVVLHSFGAKFFNHSGNDVSESGELNLCTAKHDLIDLLPRLLITA